MSLATKLEKLSFGKTQQIRLLTQLFHLVKAGVPAPDALRHMSKAYAKKRNKGMELVCNQMVNNAGEGRKIAEGMEDWFSFETCSILITSEKRGILAEGIKNIIEYLSSGNQFLKPFRKCITGVVYIISLLISIAVIGTNYLPKIGQYSKNWPGISTSLYSFAKALYYGYPIIIAAFAAIVIVIIWSVKNYRRDLRAIPAMPFMTLYKAVHSYNLLKILSLLSKNGVSVPEIIKLLCKQFKHGYVSRCFENMQKRIRAGEQNMGEVMDTGLFNSQQISELQLISSYVGEENYAEIFTAMSEIIFEQSLRITETIAGIFNVLSLVLMAGGILWVYGAYAMLASSITA